MWKEAADAQDLAIELDKNHTADRINAETDLLVEDAWSDKDDTCS